MFFGVWIGPERYRLSRARVQGALDPAACRRVLAALESGGSALAQVRWFLEDTFVEPRWLSDAEALSLLRRGLEEGRWFLAREAPPRAAEMPDEEPVGPLGPAPDDAGDYIPLMTHAAHLATEVATDGVWAVPALGLLEEGGRLLGAAALENAPEWFDYQDDDWWGESMLTAAGSGAIAGLVGSALSGGEGYGHDGGIWSAVGGAAAGGLGAFATGALGGDDWYDALGQLAVGAAVGAAAAFAVYILSNEGPEDLEEYPPTEDYLLPYSGSRHCVQGNHGFISHTNGSEFAYDFGIPAGAPVLCSYPGKVVQVIDCYHGNNTSNGNTTANRVVVEMAGGPNTGPAGTGTTAPAGKFCHYLHHQQWGARVKVGMEVEAGQVLALAGNVGISMVNHVHIFVADSIGGASIPFKFMDVSCDGADGVPRTNVAYRSDNRNRGIHPDWPYDGGETRARHDDLVASGEESFCNPGSRGHYEGEDA